MVWKALEAVGAEVFVQVRLGGKSIWGPQRGLDKCAQSPEDAGSRPKFTELEFGRNGATGRIRCRRAEFGQQIVLEVPMFAEIRALCGRFRPNFG